MKSKGDRIIITIVGVVFIAIGIILWIVRGNMNEKIDEKQKINDNAVQVVANVDKVEKEFYDGGTKQRYVAYLSYEAEGEEYSQRPVTEKAYELKVNDYKQIIAYYDKDRPWEVRLALYDEESIKEYRKKSNLIIPMVVMFIFLGGVAVCAALFGKSNNE